MSSLPRMGVAPFKIKLSETGTIKDIKKMIVRITGLPSCLNGQLVDFGGGSKGIVMGFDEEDVLALLLGDDSSVRLGQVVSGISEPFTIPIGGGYLGRMVDALGNPCDNKGEIHADAHRAVFSNSPLLTERAPVTSFLHSGTKVIDALVPLGKGQRQLIMGDRMTGKTTIGVDAILSQKGRDVVCIYCCIGKAVVALEKVVGLLAERGCLPFSVIVAAPDSATAGEQYIVPFTAATIGDWFMRQGKDVLVVFDDLTKHAWAYRQLSLLLERPPGREAYPGDIFYIQTQLMERAGQLSREHGGGSMTFVGIADTLQGDLTGFIPSNLISICDGMVSLSTALFGEGMRPAVDFNLSISIVGARAQAPILRQLSGSLRRDNMQYLEVARLSKLQSGLSKEAEQVLKRGHATLAVLQQPQNKQVSLGEEAVLLYALRMSVLDDLDARDRTRFQEEIIPFIRRTDESLLSEIEARPELIPSIDKRLSSVIKGYFGQRAV
ncbi:MAG: F0F1 ATP synthase subunit alpha [bacterium]